MKFLYLILILFICETSFAEKKIQQKKLTLFQKAIADCLGNDLVVQKLNKLSELYGAIEVRYPLVLSNVLEREVIFNEKKITKKLKLKDGKVLLFLVSEDQTLTPLNNEVRQKSLTIESYLNQLLIHADIKTDWMKTKEVRSGQSVVVISKDESSIKSLIFQKLDDSKTLDCSREQSVDICTCRSSK